MTSDTIAWSEPGREIDVAQLQRALQDALPPCADGSHRIDALRVLKVRRSSSRRADPHPVRLWLELQWRHITSGRSGTQRLYGKAWRDGASAQALNTARSQATCMPDFGAAVSHVPALDLLLWAWPNDPTLTQLPMLLDPVRARQHVPGAATATLGTPELLRYEPEQRAMLRYTLQLPDGGTRAVFGKTFADDLAERLHERFLHFHHTAERDAHAPRVAEPLGFDRTTHTFWQAAARGVPLHERLHDSGAPERFVAVGRALARLHAAPLRGSGERPLSHWLAELERRRKKIARGAPALAARVAAVVHTLTDAARRLPAVAPRLIHGDFHLDQVWVDGGRAVFFDFDEFCLGHPMEDLASFGVKLQQTALPRARSDLLLQAFEHGYRDLAEAGFCAAGLAWHRALQALLQASRAFVFQVPGWPTELEWRLARTEALVQEIRA